MFLKKLFLFFTLFTINVFCFARQNDVFYDSENDRVLQLIENERLQEELYRKKQEEKELKKLRKLEKKEKKKLKKEAKKRGEIIFQDSNFEEKNENKINNSDESEDFDILNFDYLKNKSNQKKVISEAMEKNKVSLKVTENKTNQSSSDIKEELENTEKFNNFEIVTRISTSDVSDSSKNNFIQEKNNEIVILRDPNLKKFNNKNKKVESVKSNKITNKKNNNFSINRNKSLRKQKFEINKNIKSIYFQNDSSYITNRYKKILDSNILWLKKHNQYKILIIGHTDKLGKVEYNIKLGQDRANAVKKYFIRYGIPSSRIQAISYGSVKSKGIRENFDRKVEILIY